MSRERRDSPSQSQSIPWVPSCIPAASRIPAASPARLGGSIPQPGRSFATGSLGKETPWLWDSGCVWILLLFPEFVLQTTCRKQESPLPGHLPGLLLFLLEIPSPIPDLMAPSIGMQRPPPWFGAAEGQDGTRGHGEGHGWSPGASQGGVLPYWDHHGSNPVAYWGQWVPMGLGAGALKGAQWEAGNGDTWRHLSRAPHGTHGWVPHPAWSTQGPKTSQHPGWSLGDPQGMHRNDAFGVSDGKAAPAARPLRPLSGGFGMNPSGFGVRAPNWSQKGDFSA